MGHLVPPIRDKSIEDTKKLVRAALQHLAQAAMAAERDGSKAASPPPEGQAVLYWGVASKRRPVEIQPLPLDDWTVAAGGTKEEPVRQSLAEVMNLCATMYRLLDVLEWCAKQPTLNEAHVKVCHPTTSSDAKTLTAGRDGSPERGKQPGDNDIVLVDDAGRELARFEVSDVASNDDGNGKVVKDLTSLGLLEGKCARRPATDCRHFLVISDEFWDYVRARAGANSFAADSCRVRFAAVRKQGQEWPPAPSTAREYDPLATVLVEASVHETAPRFSRGDRVRFTFNKRESEGRVRALRWKKTDCSYEYQLDMALPGEREVKGWYVEAALTPLD